MSADTIDIRPLRKLREFRACVELQEETWGPFSEGVPVAILRAAQRLGGVCSGAFDSRGRLVGFVFGMTGVEAGRLVHWSDMLAVRPELRNQGLGKRLKRHQREELLDRGVETVYWTFEPLEAKNAYFNLARLGAVAAAYYPDYYGDTSSPLHRGIGTDRLLAVWRIASPRVHDRLAGEGARTIAAAVAGAPLLNPVTGTVDGLRSAEPRLDVEQPAVRIAIPADIQGLKSRHPDLALEWRRHTRVAFSTYLERGYEAGEFVRETDSWGSYLLVRAPSTTDADTKSTTEDLDAG